MSDQYLILHGFNGTFEVPMTAFQIRDAAIAKAAEFGKPISDGAMLETASEAMARMKQIERAFEKARKEKKAPVDELVKDIQTKAHNFTAPLEKEITRLGELINHFQRQEADRKRQEAAKVDADRIKAEQAAAALKTEMEAAASAGDIGKQMELETAALELPVAPTPIIVAPIKTAHATAREVFDFKVTNWHQSILATPNLWRFEEDAETI